MEHGVFETVHGGDSVAGEDDEARPYEGYLARIEVGWKSELLRKMGIRVTWRPRDPARGTAKDCI
jgi:hypothetical protein